MPVTDDEQALEGPVSRLQPRPEIRKRTFLPSVERRATGVCANSYADSVQMADVTVITANWPHKFHYAFVLIARGCSISQQRSM